MLSANTTSNSWRYVIVLGRFPHRADLQKSRLGAVLNWVGRGLSHPSTSFPKARAIVT